MYLAIVEDDRDKSFALRECVQGVLDSARVETFESFNSALRAVRASCPDILLLDMNLPTFDRRPGGREGRLRPVGGYDLLRKMKLSGLEPITIIVSQLESFEEGEERMSFSEVCAKCAREFPGTYRGAVKFELAGSVWKEELANILRTLIQ